WPSGATPAPRTTGRCSRSSSSCSRPRKRPSGSPSSSASTRCSRPSTWTRPTGCAGDRMTDPAAASVSAPYLALIPLLPLGGGVVLGLGGAWLQKRLGKGPIGWIACATVGVSFLLSVAVVVQLAGLPPAGGRPLAGPSPRLHV